MKRILSRVCIIAASCVLLVSGIVPIRAEGEDFDAFLKQEWIDMMEADYLTMHYSVKDPEKMGVKKPEATLGHISYASTEADRQARLASLDKLHAFNYESLDERQKTDYKTYESCLTNDAVIFSYPDFREMFNPYNGLYSTVTSNLTEFVFYTKQDIDDYLLLLEDYDRYLDEMMEMTEKQVANGYFMSDAALDIQLEKMQSFIDKGEENPLIVIFNSRMDEFEGLTEEEREACKEKNKELVLKKILPSNEKQMNVLKTFRGSRKFSSICEFPGGKEYYTALAAKKTNSSDSLQEMLDYLQKAAKEVMLYFTDCMIAYIGTQSEEGSVIDEFNSPEEILAYLSSHTEGFPKGPEIKYTISYLDPSVADPTAMAYYITPPVDDLTENVIRINGSTDAGTDKNTLYYTLAHEGIPGHMYQFTWYYSQDYNLIRHELSLLGYSEGWSQYVERIMLSRSSLNKISEEAVGCNVLLGYTVQAGIDIAVNGLGYTNEQINKWIKDSGLSDMDIDPVIDAVRDSPATILPYGYGMMKFWEYREKTQSALGEDFNLEDFHLQLLTNGPRPFDVLENDIRTYVESKGKKYPGSFTFLESERTPAMKKVGSIMLYVKEHPLQILAIAGVIAIIGIVLIVLFVIFIIKLIFGKKKKKAAY